MKSEWPTICGSRHLHVAALWLATLAVPPGLLAQDPMSRAFDLERRGSYAQAVEIYFAVLKERPAELTALLGLERSLTPLNRSSELLAPVQAAITASPGSVPLYAIGMRAYAAADLLDSLPRLVDLWAKAAPGDESPYREWASAALSRRDRATARRAYELGRERLGKPDVLAAEMAQLAVLDGDWPAAVREWCRAVRQLPGYRTSAINALSPAPDRARPDILKSLDREPGPEAARIAVDLRARWGDPLGALESLMKVLPASQGQQVDVLQGFLEELRGEGSRPYLLAQGKVLEAIADRWTGSAQRARLRLESARAYAGAGDRVAARRLLGQIANDSGSGAVAAGASATLIELLVQDGKPDDAAAQLEKYHSTLGVDDYLRLRRAIAARWGQSGDLKRAEELVANDSSVEALALLGRLRLYAGDLKGTSDLWKQAGPFAGTRDEATQRSTILALIQPISVDSVQGLGHGFQLLDGGDSLAAAKAFAETGAALPIDGGRAEVTLFAGRLYGALGRKDAAEAALRAAVLKESPGTAAAALLELGRFYLGLDQRDEASKVLERMILDYPTSALVPQARRLLDQANGGVPRT